MIHQMEAEILSYLMINVNDMILYAGMIEKLTRIVKNNNF